MALAAIHLAGCRTGDHVLPAPITAGASDARFSELIRQTTFADASAPPVVREDLLVPPPPRIRDFDAVTPWPMSLDEAVRLALQHSPVVPSGGGRVLALADAAHTMLDPMIQSSDPNFGPEAALSAFDTQFETGVVWNGGGHPLTAGTLGLYPQPTTSARVGFSRTLQTGTRLSVGGFGGYDTDLASGAYALYGGELRQPLLRGAGTEFNRIAGPFGSPGNYRGVVIAQLDTDKAHLDLEQAVQELVHEVALTYWELYFAYQNLETKRAALELARQLWQREQTRVAEQLSPPDVEATARQQYFAAEAAVQNAISGTGPAPPGIFDVELKLRCLLGLPATDGALIRPTDSPLVAEFHFDWNECVQLALAGRVELRKKRANVRKVEFEVKAARNLQRPQLDFVGQYRRLADDPSGASSDLTELLQGWQIGVELKRPLGNRREHAALQNAELRLSRERALLNDQERQLSAQLRTAFTELDRAYGVKESLAISSEAARVRLLAEAKRHAVGDAPIERVQEAQIRATQAETAYQRSIVEYNLAFINLHYARSTLLRMLDVGFAEHSVP